MKYFFLTVLYSIVITIVLMLVIAGFYLVNDGTLEIAFFQSKGAQTGLLRGIGLGIVGSYLSYSLHKAMPAEDLAWKRYFYYLLLSFIIVPIVILGMNILLFTDRSLDGIKAYVSELRWDFALFPTFTFIIIGSIFYGLFFYSSYKNKQIKKQKSIAGEATAQLETLKNQIDPHFLFNSLNVLIGLIEEDKQNAITYTKSLSSIYRYILTQKDKELTSIQEELSFARSYISLLKLRFEDGINYQEGIIEAESKEIVPLSLQLLLENCIQHNRISEENPLTISIYQEGSKLVVSNNLQEKNSPNPSTKIGLANIVDRYALLSKEEVIIEKSDTYFKVKIPII
ncbi:sensor histidine kinase [Sphingobacterium sp. CZ-2]|uniref:sensor histidine kinase n=1 Tax=Sphingobacterium sp. CZ-2 TaxID=2557994 RepID=UPI001070184B|nr:histidine kinase [Sphingobacterium sp. CZ-2]QBR10763.1 histidine kinase [Sphingobacterium sp. CZ-2]